MRVYVAGGFLEKDLISSYMRRLEAHGMTISCDWTKAEEGPPKTSDADLSHEEQSRFALADLEGVVTADVVWHIVAGYKGSRGAYVEVGYAMAIRDAARGVRYDVKPEIIVSGHDWRKSIFHALADARFFEHEEAFNHLLSLKERMVKEASSL